MVLVNAISLATVPVFGFLFALLTKHFAFGLAIPVLFITAWYMLADNGADYTYPADQVFVNWIWATAVGALLGHMISYLFNWHPLLDGHYLLWGESKTAMKQKRFTAMMAIMLLFIFLLMVAHVPLEAAPAHDWPVWAGGLVTTVVIALVWTLFWYLLSKQTEKLRAMPSVDDPDRPIFVQVIDTSVPEEEGMKQKYIIDELFPFILICGLVYDLYVTVYWIWETFMPTSQWIGDQWYFFSSLCIWGLFMLILIPLGIYMSRRSRSRYDDAMKKGKKYVAPAKQEEEEAEEVEEVKEGLLSRLPFIKANKKVIAHTVGAFVNAFPSSQ